MAASVSGRPTAQNGSSSCSCGQAGQAAPIEAADYAHEIGAKVIAITSIAYSTAIANGRRRLAEVADIVLDNGLPPGDAVVEKKTARRRAFEPATPGQGEKRGSVSFISVSGP